MSKLRKNKILFFEFHFIAIRLQRVLFSLERKKCAAERLLRTPLYFPEKTYIAVCSIKGNALMTFSHRT